MSEQHISLRDGRRLAYAELGVADGRPLVFFPGMPGSRLYGRQLEPAATELGFRVVTYDLPGHGGSDHHPTRTLAGTAGDVEEVADQLGFERFDVLGAAGGGAHALACAWRCGERLGRVALVNSATPPGPAAAGEGSSAGQRLLRRAAVTPWANRAVMGLVALGARHSPGFILKRMEQTSSGDDRAILARSEVRELITTAATDAFRAGSRGPAQEMALLTGPWGLSLGEISVEVDLWQAEDDPTYGADAVERLAGAIPRCNITFVPGAGQLWLFDHAGVPLRALLRS